MNEDLNPQKKSRIGLLIAVLAFVVFAGVIWLVFVPKIRAAWALSGVPRLLEAAAENEKTAAADTASVCFVVRNDQSISFRMTECTLSGAPTTGHAVLEALLKGPGRKSGLQTLIPPGTRLIGFTYKSGRAFADFSGAFDDDPETTFLSIQQVSRTLKSAYPSMTGLTILVNGSVIYESD